MQLSRSEQKRRVKEVEKLVKELASLSGAALADAPCLAEIREMLHESRTMKGGAKKRQLKYITKLLKDEPLDELYKFLAEKKSPALSEKQQLHELEYLRDTLIDEAINLHKERQADFTILEENWTGNILLAIEERFSSVDIKSLSRLSAIFARTRQVRHSREIFRILKAAWEKDKRNTTIKEQ